MATTNAGSFNTSAYETRYLHFDWWINSQDIANNQTTIGWQLVGAGNDTLWYMCGPITLTIDGDTVYNYTGRKQVRSGTLLASGTKTLTHDSAGNRYFAASCRAAIYMGSVNCTGSNDWNITQIPRAATAISGPNLTDESNSATITYSNPAGNSVSDLEACISFNGSSIDIPYRAISKTGTSYTFNFTAEEKATLLQRLQNCNSCTAHYYIRTVIGSNTFYTHTSFTLSCVNCAPTIYGGTAKDINASTKAITEDDTKIIQGKSDLQITYSCNLLKGATLSKIDYYINGTWIASGTDPSCYNIGTVSEQNDITIKAVLTDSRGNTDYYERTIPVIPYATPYVTAQLGRINNFEVETKLTANANFSSISGKNSAVMYYAYNQVGTGDWSVQQPISSGETIIVSLDRQYAYNVVVSIEDKLEYRQYVFTVAKGIPIMFYDTEKLSIGANMFPTHDDAFEAHRMYLGGYLISDHIVETGEGGNWKWEKYASGIAVVHGSFSYTEAIKTAVGAIFAGDEHSESFPSGLFVSAPECNVYISGSNCWAWHEQIDDPTKDKTPRFTFLRHSACDIGTITVGITARGNWK